ncbi:EamA family transporter RarD [Trinickia dabaoshanensis]|uniref:EamA family transporter RarD n=1 Tax=Trinickia dabaoshanensis TaxID=564714 RepID=A0A2N7VD91_9BURK|nr:EamA family transporter RarD [Trinickia dabaoshanensis]PMS15122.1 EamA family transporter RarD [Trinickia dabaoshanensis]
MNSKQMGRGIALSVGATTLFALLSVYTRILHPLGGLDIFAWRIVWTVPGALLLAWMRGRGGELTALAWAYLRDPFRALMLLAASALLGTQLWLFMWAPLHGRLLEVSLGYFLLPLTMVLVGRVYYREQLVPLQWLAVGFATLGVAHELWVTHAFSWPTLVVALGYPPYFVLRRKLGGDSLATFALEMLLMLPIAGAVIALSPSAQAAFDRPLLWAVLLPGLGALSTVALASYLAASRLLPMALFGILGYVEPVLLVLFSVTLLGETLSVRQIGTYAPIWMAVAITAVHSVLLLREQRRD